MADRPYDDTIASHYRKIAEAAGDSASSTMLDEVIRARETDAIHRFVAWAADRLGREIELADVGCGNGYTLDTLSVGFPLHTYAGYELTDELRAIAEQRFRDRDVTIAPGDIREANFSAGRRFDVLVSQRVLINLLDADDQKRALDHLIETVHVDGFLLFIEAFGTPLARLNVARDEVGLDAISPAHHNLYLEDGFFDVERLEPIEGDVWGVPTNDLSTHYFVSRVLAPYMFRERGFKRNSEIAAFFSAALPPAIGDYSPLHVRAFRRVS